MTVADDVVQALRGSATGMTDVELPAMPGKRHAPINQPCRAAAGLGLIIRDSSRGQITNRLAAGLPPQTTEDESPVPVADPAEDWAWEGNVQSHLVTHLATTGWKMSAVVDTARRETGPDIIAERADSRQLVEVKGWPSTTSARGERAGQPKRTQPTLQATYWFAEGLTRLVLRGPEAGALLALALPDKPRYRSLVAEAGWALVAA